jgi:predicted RNA-binding protein with PUA-like domain
VAVALAPGRPLAAPVTLATLRAEPAFRGSPLVVMGRLSVLPLGAAQWKVIERLGRQPH